MKHGGLPISTVVPTRNRAEVLRRMLTSLAQQSLQPIEMVVVDASTSSETEHLCRTGLAGLQAKIIYHKAREVGAAAQRNRGVAIATQPFVWFCDDDIVFEPECLGRLWHGVQSDSKIGGCNAMIINQRYQPPGLASRLLFQVMNGRSAESYAGRVIGPAINLLPEDRDDLPEIVPVEWLNTTCTLYRGDALPDPPFSSFFSGYSLGEDLALSITVGHRWKLANVRTARIYHELREGGAKMKARLFAEMELINRHFIMTQVLGKRTAVDYARLILFESFGLATSLRTRHGWSNLPAVMAGKILGTAAILRQSKSCSRL